MLACTHTKAQHTTAQHSAAKSQHSTPICRTTNTPQLGAPSGWAPLATCMPALSWTPQPPVQHRAIHQAGLNISNIPSTHKVPQTLFASIACSPMGPLLPHHHHPAHQ
jgi:hypothetical protein